MFKIVWHASSVSCLGWSSVPVVLDECYTSLDTARQVAKDLDKCCFPPCHSVVQVTPATNVTVFTTFCPTCTR